MKSVEQQIEQLKHTAHTLIHLGDETGFVYADDTGRLNREIYEQIATLYPQSGKDTEQEAAICSALLLGYSTIMYGNEEDEQQKQEILNRSLKVLGKLPPSLLKCQLLTYCYGEVYEEELAQEAHDIISDWKNRELSEEEQEIIKVLEIIES